MRARTGGVKGCNGLLLGLEFYDCIPAFGLTDLACGLQRQIWPMHGTHLGTMHKLARPKVSGKDVPAKSVVQRCAAP